MHATLAFALLKALALTALPLFLAAGTLAWPNAWIWLALLVGSTAVTTTMLLRHDPALLEERLKGAYQEGQPLWDKLILTFFMILWLAWLVVIGLDAGRYHWSAMPVWLELLGGAGVAIAYVGFHLVFRTNSFLAPVVRLQTERAQRVISTGPYAVVRHPMYAAALLLFAATPLLLGSWCGLVVALALAALLVLRTALEDRALQRGLPGYSDYARWVKYRLVPLIW